MTSIRIESLQTYLERALPDKEGIRVRDLAKLTSGWESEMFAFDLEYGLPGKRQRWELILRLYPGDDAHAKSAHEFHALHNLQRTGYPAPGVLLLERQNSPFGAPFIIEQRIAGREMWQLLLDSSERDQQSLIAQFCELFVRLHRLDWRVFVDDERCCEALDPFLFVDRWIVLAHQALERYPSQGFRAALAWLERRRIELPCPAPSPVHLDFHPGNVLLRADGSAVVIDWTAFDVSDARFDLAWTLILAHAYLGEGWRQRLLNEYERLWGSKVEQIEVFEVFACLRRLFDAAVSLSQGAEKQGMRPGAVEQMRQQMGAYQRVYDLLHDRSGLRIAEIERLLQA